MGTAPVKTRHISIFASDGTRLKKVAWGKVRVWKNATDTATNLRQAIAFANATLQKRLGTIVYVGTIPVYHCKYGGKSSYRGWKSNPVANMWRKKIAG